MKRAIISACLGITLVALCVGVFAYAHRRRQPPMIPRMLLEISRHADPLTNAFMNTARAEALRAKLKNSFELRDPIDGVMLEMRLADEFTNAGRTDEALQEYRLIEEHRQDLTPPTRDVVMGRLLTK